MQKLAPGHLFPAIKVGVLLEKTLQMLFFFKKLYFSQVLQYWIIRLALQLQWHGSAQDEEQKSNELGKDANWRKARRLEPGKEAKAVLEQVGAGDQQRAHHRRGDPLDREGGGKSKHPGVVDQAVPLQPHRPGGAQGGRPGDQSTLPGDRCERDGAAGGQGGAAEGEDGQVHLRDWRVGPLLDWAWTI